MRRPGAPADDDAVDFEDDRAMLAKDSQTRRRYLRWFNKCREDFDSDRAYDDYLEMVEDIIYKLVNGIDVEETKAQVERYRQENADIIGLNQARRIEEDRAAAEQVAAVERERLARLAEVRAEDAAREKEAARAKRIAEAEELVRVAHGEEEWKKMVRKREKKERKERKKQLKEEQAAAEANVPNIEPQWFKPCFPSALPTIMSAPERPKDGTTQVPQDVSSEATAGGFETGLLLTRADEEFEQSLSIAMDHLGLEHKQMDGGMSDGN